MDALCSLNPGDSARFTTEREGEELELDAYILGDTFREEPERRGLGWTDGELEIRMELSSETIERLDGAGPTATFTAKERKPGEWERASFTVWDPEVQDGEVVREDWTALGEITDVERVEGSD